MPISTKVWKTVGIGLGVFVLGFAVVWTWVVPALIVRAIQAQVDGKVTIRDWWLNGRSAGVVGLTVHETPKAASAVLVTVERVATDLSLGGLLLGRTNPGRIELERPEIRLKVDSKGQIVNLPTLNGAGRLARLPVVATDAARVVFEREGRHAGGVQNMVVSGVSARLQPDPSGQRLTVSGGTADPTWGRWTASGSIVPGEHRGNVQLRGTRVQADLKTMERVPFIPDEVWTHVVPNGPVAVEVSLDWAQGRTPEYQAKTAVTLLGASAQFPTLGLAADRTTGTLRIEGRLVRAEGVRGQALGGLVDGGGTLDFGRATPQIDLDLHLKQINVEQTPKLWQLDEAGITGLLTGTVALRASLDQTGVDLSGSTGVATVENATIQGIPVKSLRLSMRAQGRELEYDTKSPDASCVGSHSETLVVSRPWLHSLARGLTMGTLVAFQAPEVTSPAPDSKPAPEPPATERKPKPEEPGRFSVKLPKTISTELELEDVDLTQLIAKAQWLSAFPFPVPISGKISLKAKATIPLGAMSDVKQYAFHGDLTLKRASVFKVDLAELTARLDLENGLLELKQLRGLLIDRPDGGPDNPPRSKGPEVPAEGSLPTGGFRGDLRAELAPPGRFSARFEGNLLPLGELSAPLLARPTPLAGLVSMNLEAETDLAKLGDPTAWSVSGRAESLHITYRNESLERVAFRFQLAQGRFELPEFNALMAGHPLSIKGEAELKAPMTYRGHLNVDEWDLATIAAFVPNLPHPMPLAGSLSARADVEGTVTPWKLTTEGQGQVARFVVGSVPLGAVPFRWSTDGDSVLISDVEAHPFGGKISAEAHIPIAGGGAAEGTATIRQIDTAQLSEAIPGQELKLAGKADGTIAFVVPRHGRGVEANVRITSPELTFQGIPAQQVRASVRAQKGGLRYEVSADSLGGKLKVRGDFPLSRAEPPASSSFADGELRLDEFKLDQVWEALNVSGPTALLAGQGSINANTRSVPEGADAGFWAHGIVRLGQLKWGQQGEPSVSLGQLRGVVTKAPNLWRIEPLSGSLMGGAANGLVWGKSASPQTPEVGFNLRIERALLNRLLGFAPSVSKRLSGLGTIQVSGRLDESIRAEAGLNVVNAQFAGVPISELNVPLNLVLSPSTGAGTLQIRRTSARFSGGTVRGDASFRIGANRSFQGQVQLADLDLHTLHQIATDSSRLVAGRISGLVTLSGPDPRQPERYRGRVNLDLDDAALFSIPVFREVEKFFGSARGGLFEDGDLVGAIANRQLVIESLTLEGRIVQLHVTGTVGFDTQLNLVVLVNTSQLIPETGQALLARIPGLKEVLGRNERAFAQVATFLSNRLVKLRVTGTLKQPSVAADASVLVAETAVAFFAGVLKLPLGILR